MYYKEARYADLYLDLADRLAQMSYARRAQVGAVIVRDNDILSTGWNGMPAGMDNCCETHEDAWLMGGKLVTRPEVQHAEENAILKLAKRTESAAGATMYTSIEPCYNCARMAYGAGISRFVYRKSYTGSVASGIKFLSDRGILVIKHESPIRNIP